MKKIKFIVLGLAALTVILAFLGGVIWPLNDIVGCYSQNNIQPYDKICLREDKTYEQFSLDNKIKEYKLYNKGIWRSYKASEDNGEVLGVVLEQYFDRHGDNSELDIFPYRNMFGMPIFVAGDYSSGERFYRRHY